MQSLGQPLVVMGVSGSGKSTVGAALAQRLRVPFADADDLHPPENIAKMSAGEALDDDDRYPGLEGSREVIERRQASRPSHFMPASLLDSQFALGAMFAKLLADSGGAGPLFGSIAGRWVVVEAPHTWDTDERDDAHRPSFGVTIATVLLPVVLMLGKAIVDIVIDDPENRVQQVADVIGNPFVALLISVLVAMVTFGVGDHLRVAAPDCSPPARRRSPRSPRAR